MFRRLFGRKEPDREPSPFPEVQEAVGEAYRLVERLDYDTYVAESPQGSKHLIKTFPLADPQRIQRGFIVARDLTHPHLAPYLDGGLGPPAWMARPVTEGQPLSEFLRRGPQSPEMVTEFMEQVFAALDYLHSQGLVYANWRVENILRIEDRWILTEVGLGLIPMEPDLVQVGPPRRQPGLPYVPPEVIMESKRPHPRSDLYSLAAMAYHLLVGQPPFGTVDDEPMATVFKILKEEPTSLLTLQPSLPKNLVELIESLMKKTPEERPGEIFDLLAKLRDQPVEASTPAGQELSNFLEQASSEGRKADENGRFTLDPAKALEKLAQFQFARPHDYLLPLVAAGHALKASAISFKTQKSGLKVHYDCPEISKEQLQQLFLAAVQSAGNPLSHLGRGVVGALATGARMVLTSGQWKANIDAIVTPTVTSGRGTGVSLEILGETPKSFPPELIRRIQLAEARLTWDGETLNLPTNLVLLGKHEGFRILGALRSREPGLYLRVDGLTYHGGFHQLSPTVLVLDGPWPLDLSYQGIPSNGRKGHLETLSQELMLAKIEDLFRNQPLRLDRPKTYLSLLPLMKDNQVLDRFANRVVVAAPDPQEIRGPSELVNLLARSCARVRSQGLSSVRRATTLLATPPVYHAWTEKSWQAALSIARELHPTRPPDYWRFLLRSWVLYGGRPDLLAELPQMLPFLGELPETKWGEWDVALLENLKALARQNSGHTMQQCSSWKSHLPDGGFPFTRAWLDRPDF